MPRRLLNAIGRGRSSDAECDPEVVASETESVLLAALDDSDDAADMLADAAEDARSDADAEGRGRIVPLAIGVVAAAAAMVAVVVRKRRS